MKRAVLLILAVLFAPVPARAQSLWIPRDRAGSVTIEALRPGLEFVDESFAGTFFLDLRAPLQGKAWLVAEVPFALVSGDYLIFIGSSSHFSRSSPGNVYLGLETSAGDSPFFGEFGVRVPTTPSGTDLVAAETGADSDFGRFNTFYPKVFSMQGVFNARTVSAGGIASRLRLGSALAVSTEGGDPEVFGLYSWQTGYEGHAVRVGVAASGTVLVTEDFGNLGSRATTQLELHGDFGAGRVRPGLDAKLPLGSAASLVSVVLGASVSVGLGSSPTSE